MVEDMEEEEEELVWLALHLVVLGFLVVVVSVKLCGDWNFGWLDMKVESCWVLGKANSMFEIVAAIFFEPHGSDSEDKMMLCGMLFIEPRKRLSKKEEPRK